MTESIVETARRVAPRLPIKGLTSHHGPPAIQGARDGALAVPPLLAMVRTLAAPPPRGIIIGCFDDTGCEEVGKIVPIPVVGIGQACFHYCAIRNWRFSVVTTLAVSIPVIEENIRNSGLGGHLGRVRAANIPVLDLEASSDACQQRITEEAGMALREDNIDAVILGCAGMVHVSEAAQRELDCPILDPVKIATRCMEWLLSASDRSR